MEKFAAFFIITFLSGNALALLEKPDSKIQPYTLEDTINSTIQDIISSLPDPFVIEDTLDLTLTDDNTIISGLIEIINPNIRGLHFEVPALSLTMVGVWFNFTFVFPSLEINSNYLTDSLVLTVLPIYGNGTARIVIDGLQLMGSTEFDLNPPAPQLKNLRISFTVADINVAIQGLLYDEEFSQVASDLINLLATDIIVPYLDDNTDAISDLISPTIEDLVNGILASISTTTSPPETTPQTSSSLNNNNLENV